MTVSDSIDVSQHATVDEIAFSEKMGEIANLIERLEAGDPETRDFARQLTQKLLDLHKEWVSRIWASLSKHLPPESLAHEKCLGDPVVSRLLMLHDLHPVDFEVRVRQALESARPGLKSLGGDVAVIDFVDRTVRLRLFGSCTGRQSTRRSMQALIGAALYETAADTVAVIWEDSPENSPPQARGFVPLERLDFANTSQVQG